MLMAQSKNRFIGSPPRGRPAGTLAPPRQNTTPMKKPALGSRWSTALGCRSAGMRRSVTDRAPRPRRRPTGVGVELGCVRRRCRSVDRGRRPPVDDRWVTPGTSAERGRDALAPLAPESGRTPSGYESAKSRTQALAALGSAGAEHRTTATGGGPSPEPVLVGPLAVIGLKRALHERTLLDDRRRRNRLEKSAGFGREITNFQKRTFRWSITRALRAGR